MSRSGKVPVGAFMSQPPVTIRPEATLVELVAELQENEVRTMSVVDEAGNLVGVVSETDLFIKEKGVPFSMEKVPTLLGQAIGEDQIDDLRRKPGSHARIKAEGRPDRLGAALDASMAGRFYEIRTTFSAAGPLVPCVTSNSTMSPSFRDLKPSA